jgi:nitrogen-specific signal transduction histidine kinase
MPGILQKYGLDASISRIEVDEDTLETIVLGMIHDQAQAPAGEVEHEPAA